jgi:benzoyl-CoA reductase subunit B
VSDAGADPLVGRALREGGLLFRDWFGGLERGAAAGRGAANVFVMGSLAELLRAFDLDLVFPEINSLQTAVRRAAAPYLNQAEEIGYSPDICGYVKADVAVQARGGEHPMGRIPPPRLAVLTTACSTYVKWAEIWERLYEVPVFTLDIPGTRCVPGGTGGGDGDAASAADTAYVAAQVRELVGSLEALTGRRLDLDRLRQNLAWSNRMHRAWRRALAANAARPAPFNALVDGTVYLGMMNAFRGTEAGAIYAEQLAEELEYKAAHGIGSLTDERFRLVFLGVPCYPIFRRFNDMFTGNGGVFVTSTYLWFASGGAHRELEYDLDRPLDSLAEGLLRSTRAAVDGMFFMDQAVLELAEPYGLDGAVFHAVKSCRTTSSGMADGRRALLARRDLPSLLLESDMMDQRVVSEAQLKNRVDAFFEGMAARRLAAAGAAR